VDFIDFDSQLNDEEKLVPQTAREFVENDNYSLSKGHSRESHVSDAPGFRTGLNWAFFAGPPPKKKLAGLGFGGNVQRGLRAMTQ